MREGLVSVVAHASEANALGRAGILADLLEPYHPVEIVAFGDRIWLPMAGDSRIHLIPRPRTNFGIPRALAELRQRLQQSVAVVAVKPRVLSYGLTMAAREQQRLVLDVDDMETEFVRRRLGWMRQLFTPDHWPATAALCRIRGRRTRVTVASRALQRSYGGLWLPHVRDRRAFRDQRLRRREEARRKLGIAARELVLGFVGTVRRHKGLDVLEQVMAADPNLVLLIAGDVPEADAIRRLRTQPGGRVVVNPGPKLSDVGEALAAVDVAVVPQSAAVAAQYQSPAKLLDAMAAGLPTVAGDVGDAREILGTAGILIDVSDGGAWGHAVRALNDDGLRGRLGEAAYDRWTAEYTPAKWQNRLVEHIWRPGQDQ